MILKDCQYLIKGGKRFIYDFDQGEYIECLVDVSSTGHENPLKEKKAYTDYLKTVYDYISKTSDETGKFLDFRCDPYKHNKRAQKLSLCSNYLEFAHLIDKTKHISYIESCHSSLCPTCNLFRSRRDLGYMLDIFTEFFKNPLYHSCKFLHLVLTVPSCYPEDIKSVLDRMNKAFNKFRQLPEMSCFLGGSRSLEITINTDEDSKNYGLMHPHFHVLLIAPSDYAQKGKQYLDQMYFLYLWNRCYGSHKFRKFEKFLSWYKEQFDEFGRLRFDHAPDLITQLSIEKIKVRSQSVDPDQKAKDLLFALAEFLKYPFKDDELLTGDIIFDSQNVFFLDSAMQHRRRWNVFGLLRQIKHDLHIQDEQDGDELIQIAGLSIDQIEFFSSWWWRSEYQDYLKGGQKSLKNKNLTRKKLGLPLITLQGGEE